MQIAFGGCNSRVYHELAEAHGIGSYPWVTTFYKGKKVEDMAGLGGWKSIYDFAKRKHKARGHPTPRATHCAPYACRFVFCSSRSTLRASLLAFAEV